jgi:hypothetical protein
VNIYRRRTRPVTGYGEVKFSQSQKQQAMSATTQHVLAEWFDKSRTSGACLTTGFIRFTAIESVRSVVPWLLFQYARHVTGIGSKALIQETWRP